MSMANAPDNPPLLEEGDLNPAETKVLNAFRGGWEAGARRVGILPDGSRIPALFSAVDWYGATLRANFLRGLFLGSYDTFAPRSVIISFARVEGRLDLDYCKPCFPLKFYECTFSKGISLRAATIPELVLMKCKVYQDERGISLFALQMQVTTNVALNNQVTAYGKVTLNGASIGGQLDCTSGRFERGLTAQNLETGDDVFLRNRFISNSLVDLSGANIGGLLDCTGGHFEKGLTAHNLEAGESVTLRCKFKSNGKVNLFNANIGGLLSCDGGHFENGLSARSLKTGENVLLSGGFKSNGEVFLVGADVGGQLDCHGGHFEKDIIAQKLKTREDVFLSYKFKSNGKVDLFGANIGGSLVCIDGHFENGLVADGLRYQTIVLDGDWSEGLIWLQQMRGDGFQPYEQLMTVYRRMGHPDWAREIGFALEKERHKRSKGLWRAWYSILRGTIGYGYKPFRSLRWAVGLVAAGFLFFSSGHDGIISRGIPPSWPPLAPPLACLDNEWIPSEGEALKNWKKTKQVSGKGQAPQGYPKFNPFVYSLEATFPVLPLGQLDKWHPDNTFFQWMRWILTVIGSVLLAILALFGVGTLGPNRKSEDDGG